MEPSSSTSESSIDNLLDGEDPSQFSFLIDKIASLDSGYSPSSIDCADLQKMLKTSKMCETCSHILLKESFKSKISESTMTQTGSESMAIDFVSSKYSSDDQNSTPDKRNSENIFSVEEPRKKSDIEENEIFGQEKKDMDRKCSLISNIDRQKF